MKILLVSSEAFPYSKTGGLSDMVGALAKALARAGHQVGLFTPLYSGIQARFPEIQRFDYQLEVPLGDSPEKGEVFSASPQKNLTVYFLHHPGFFHRDGIYAENGVDYPDNARRFIFFSKCAAHLARYLRWEPELVHTHDWQAGLTGVFIHHQRLHEHWWNAPRVCHTIHNLAYQGNFLSQFYPLTNLPMDYYRPEGLEFYGGFNCLKAGIAYADALTTVSPRYAREITTEAYGCGLDGILRKRQSLLHGILNGVDYEEWNTKKNPFLRHPYSINDLEGKNLEKLDLQNELGLPVSREIPLFGTISRLVEQKGVDIELGALEEMLSANMQFVLLGSGAPQYEKAFQRLARRHPQKCVVRIGFDHELSHRIEAAADFFLMPSRFEPCGLNQMYSLHYGTIPIVRITGGLDDSVTDISEDPANATGIKFSEYSVRALARAIRKALVLFEKPELVTHYRRNGMARDFSWEKTAREYESVFQIALGGAPRPAPPHVVST